MRLLTEWMMNAHRLMVSSMPNKCHFWGRPAVGKGDNCGGGSSVARVILRTWPREDSGLELRQSLNWDTGLSLESGWWWGCSWSWPPPRDAEVKLSSSLSYSCSIGPNQAALSGCWPSTVWPTRSPDASKDFLSCLLETWWSRSLTCCARPTPPRLVSFTVTPLLSTSSNNNLKLRSAGSKCAY